MTNVIFPRKEFEKHIKLDKKTIEKISLFGTPLERIDEKEIEIEIFPNRPDLISMQGYLRSFKSFLGKETGLKKYKVNKPEKNFEVKIEKSVKSIRPLTACAIIKNLKLDDEKIKEIINLQEKLHITVGRNRKKLAIGIYPLDKISLPITYTAKNPESIKFQPLESNREMSAYQILNRTPAGKKYAYLLEGFSKYPLFIDSKNKILSMPPIINSEDTGKVSINTKDVFVECSGSDEIILNKTLNIIVTTLAEMGGKIYQMNIKSEKNTQTPNLSTEKMKISLKNTNKLLGLELKSGDLEKLIPKMGHNYKSEIVEIPSWRTDILHEVDLIEDVAIAYGYDKIESEIPNIATSGKESPQGIVKRKISELLTGLGALEISTYHLIKKEEAKLSRLKDSIEVEDSKTEYKLLRPNLLIPLLRILSENTDVEYPQKIFEIGRVFPGKDPNSETEIKESDHLIFATTPGNFTEIKQVLDYLTSQTELNYELEEFIHPDLIEGRTGSIIINNKQVGYIGEVHPTTLKNWGLKMPLSLFEIDLDVFYN